MIGVGVRIRDIGRVWFWRTKEDKRSVSPSALAGRLEHAGLCPGKTKCVIILVFAEKRDELVPRIRYGALGEDVVEAADQECV